MREHVKVSHRQLSVTASTAEHAATDRYLGARFRQHRVLRPFGVNHGRLQ